MTEQIEDPEVDGPVPAKEVVVPNDDEIIEPEPTKELPTEDDLDEEEIKVKKEEEEVVEPEPSFHQEEVDI